MKVLKRDSRLGPIPSQLVPAKNFTYDIFSIQEYRSLISDVFFKVVHENVDNSVVQDITDFIYPFREVYINAKF